MPVGIESCLFAVTPAQGIDAIAGLSHARIGRERAVFVGFPFRRREIALVKATDFQNLMIFTRTRKEADSVGTMLANAGWKDEVTVMHSDIGQKERMAALKGFKEDKFRILVATDVAARGIDINGVTHVINYRVPENPEDYVHRIGRTGRAESTGDAFTLLTADEVDFAKSVEIFINRKIARRKLDGFNYAYTALLEDGPVRPVRKPRPAAPKRRRR